VGYLGGSHFRGNDKGLLGSEHSSLRWNWNQESYYQ